MIKLNRYFTPTYLNPQKVKDLTDEYKSNGKNVWAHNEIKGALLKLSNNKCAYCECELNEESKYMEVEHFQDKSTYPDKVAVWDNLLPSCKRCNVSKGTHDVVAEPIVNPFEMDPAEHLVFHLYRFQGITDEGKMTEDVLDLNNYEKVLRKRFDIGNALQESLCQVKEKLDIYETKTSIRLRNKILGHLKNVLAECTPKSSYSAASSTVLHGDENYDSITRKMKDLSIWDDELEALHNESLFCKLKYA